MRILRNGAAVALLLSVSVANAAGLGKLTINSSLGQPLNAEIDLVSLQPGELEAIQARVATPEAFRDARIEYSNAMRLLRFSVDKRASGQPYIKLTSVAPINEPFVDALIEVTWPSGRVQREYPILLDPPGYSQKASPPTVAAAQPSATQTPPATAPAASSSPDANAAASSGTPASTPATTETAPTPGPSASAEMPAGTSSSSTAKPAAEPKQASGDTYGPVQKGDTLNKIATETKPSNVSLEQMLVALYRENKGAFIGNNMNRMRTGQILRVPSEEEVAKITRGEAGKEIRTQVADWNSYREQLAGGVASTPAQPAATNASSGRVSSAAVTAPAPTQADANKDVLKLSRTDSGKAGAGASKGGAGNAERISALQEELTAKNKALNEANSRVADLEKQIRDMQRLLDLKGGAPGKGADAKVAAVTPPPATSAATKTPEPAKLSPTTPTKAPEPVKAPEPAKTEAPKPADTKVADASKPAPTTTTATTPPSTTTPAPGATTPGNAPPKVADAGKPAPKTPPKKAAPPPEPSFMDELTSNPLYWAVGGGVLLAVIAGVVVMRRRRASDEVGPISGMTSAFPSDLKPDGNTSKPGGGLVDTGNSSFLTDFDKTGPGTIDTDEVDPVAEAEVYIAYGRDAQAEEILKEAMARDKNRHEIPLKLLEIYHARKSATAFETVAKELRNAVGENHPLWQKAAAMGAQIDPNNPLYVGAAAGTATFSAMAPTTSATKKPELDFDIMGGGGPSVSETETSAPAPDFDLDLGTQKHDEHASAAPAASHTMDFDIGHAAPAVDIPTEAPKEEKSSFDFDLSGLDFPGSKPAGETAKPAASSAPSLEMTDLSLDMPGGDAGGGGGGGEAVGTKLELAKAYLEIGDKDGAREILQEVAKEGSSAQKEEAQKLIASL